MKKYLVGDDEFAQVCQGLQEALDVHYKLTLPLYNEGKEEVLQNWYRECSSKIKIKEFCEKGSENEEI